jgi:hypothetical protein
MIFRRDRSIGKCGGVCLFVKDDHKFKVQQFSLPSKFDCLEIIAIDLTDASAVLPHRIVVVYRPPDYSPVCNILLFSALDYVASGTGRLTILGDLNLPDFEWEFFVHADSLLYISAANLICNHGLTQLVCELTRGNDSLDVILRSDVLSCDNVGYLPPLGSSDHSNVSFTLNLSFHEAANDAPSIPCPNFSLADWTSLSLYLSSINWNSEFSCCASVADIRCKFTDIIEVGISSYVPHYKSPRFSHTQYHYSIFVD